MYLYQSKKTNFALGGELCKLRDTFATQRSRYSLAFHTYRLVLEDDHKNNVLVL